MGAAAVEGPPDTVMSLATPCMDQGRVGWGTRRAGGLLGDRCHSPHPMSQTMSSPADSWAELERWL